ncbi:MAG: glycerate kinase [Planctomycetes bacterium]|nr:glycerate kinase [Planctomycetota bacterium]
MAQQELITVVAAPTAFKETLTPAKAARAIAAALRPHRVIIIPVADGGDGTLDCLHAALGGRMLRRRVTGPLGQPVWARLLLAGRTAVIEMADACGLRLVPPQKRDPLRASTRGTGELILAARRAGARRILVGAGGSATVDAGRGALDVLDHARDVTVLCDVQTRLLDAPRIFGPQKGATPEMMPELDARMRTLPRRVWRMAGAGAAGGLAGGLASIGARLVPGAPAILRLVRFRPRARGADLVITGEGCLDETSLAGKIVGEVLRVSPAPVAIVCGRRMIDPGVPVEEMIAHHPDPMRHPVAALKRAVRALATQVLPAPRR